MESINIATPNGSASGLKTSSYSSALQLWRDAHIGTSPGSFNVDIVKPDGKFLNIESMFMAESIMSEFEIVPNHQLPGYAHHSTINIDEVRDLRRYPGSGTIEDPYVIEGFHITSTRKNLIQIQNTDVYITVRNNHLDNLDSTAAGILINNAHHVAVENNNILSNGNGVLVTNSFDIQVNGNDMYYSTNIAAVITNVDGFTVSGNNLTQNIDSLYISGSSNGVISDNVIYNNGGNGITLLNSNENSVTGNTIFDNALNGISVLDSHRNLFDSNDIYSNGPNGSVTSNGALTLVGNKITINAGFFGSAIFLDPSYDNTVTNNNLSGNTGSGILSEYSSGTIIDHNTISNNDITGVFFLDSDNNQITNNEISGNGDLGTITSLGLNGYEMVRAAGFFGSAIFLDPSHGNNVEGNHIFNNEANGVYLQNSMTTTVLDNDIHNNGLTGVFLEHSDFNTISNNVLNHNGMTGSGLAAQFASNAFEAKLMAGFFGSAIFLDPSTGNMINNNTITENAGVGVYLQLSDDNDVVDNKIYDNGAEGVFLEDSSYNSIDSNVLSGNGYDDSNYLGLTQLLGGNLRLMAGFFGSAIFLDPSTNNAVTNNVITSNAGSGVFLLETDNSVIDGNIISDNEGYGVELIDSDANQISMNIIDNNGDASTGALSLNAGFFGSAIFLDPSYNNKILSNNATGNTAHAVEIVASLGTQIDGNRFLENGGYGVFIDGYSGDSLVTGNNFANNNNNGTQASDSGNNDQFATNFWANHNNKDENYDGIADEPYVLDGAAGTTDAAASNIANGLNYYTTYDTVTNPRKLNADSEGTPLTVVITLGDGYRALQVDASSFKINGTGAGVDSTIDNILQFRVLFDRQIVNALVNALNMEPPFFVTFEITGRMNDNLLDLTAYAVVEINQTETPILNGSEILIVGSIAALPLTKLSFKKKEE